MSIDFQIPRSYPYSLINRDIKIQRQNQKVLSTIDQVQNILTLLMEDINNLYKENGINYDVSEHFPSISRLLIPIELLSYCINNSSTLPTENKILHKVKNDRFTNYSDSIYGTRHDSLKLIPTDYPAKVEEQLGNYQNPQKDISKINKRHYYRGNRARPVLNETAENILVQWVLNRLAANQRVRRKDIARKAIELSGYKEGFQGSIGFVNRFLQRHPQMKQQLKKVAKANIGLKMSEGELQSQKQNQQQISKFNSANVEQNQENNEANKYSKLKQQYNSEQYGSQNEMEFNEDQPSNLFNQSSSETIFDKKKNKAIVSNKKQQDNNNLLNSNAKIQNEEKQLSNSNKNYYKSSTGNQINESNKVLFKKSAQNGTINRKNENMFKK